MKKYILALVVLFLVSTTSFAIEVSNDSSMTVWRPDVFNCDNQQALDSAQAYADSLDSVGYAEADSLNNLITTECEKRDGIVWATDCMTSGGCKPGILHAIRGYGGYNCWECRGANYGIDLWQYCPLERREFRCCHKVWRVIK